MAKVLKVYGKEYVSKNGNKFNSYSLHSEKSGEWFKVKFTRECTNKPVGTGFYLLTVEPEDVSIAKGEKLENGTLTNRTIWVHDITVCVKDTASDDELEEKRNADIENL